MADEAEETGLVDSDPVSEYGTLQDALKSAVGIREFLDGRKDKQLTTGQCLTIVDEAIRLLDGLYVHLPLKRAMYAVDPIRRLRLLQYRLQRFQTPDTAAGDALAAPPDDLWFHREMNGAFTSVRDLHTTYVLPEPFDRAIAFLPFQIEECFEDEAGRKKRKFIIGNVVDELEWFDPPEGFEPGVEVTYWNGVQIERAVELAGERNAGNNPDARLARGLARLTTRPLAKSLPPDEEWVTVSYISALDQASRTLTVHWRVAQLPAGQDPPADGIMLRQAMGEGLDHEADMIRVLRGEMFGRKHRAARRSLRLRVSKSPPVAPEAKVKMLDPVKTASDFFQARTFVSDGTEYGHIRIRSFKQAHGDEVLAEFVDLLERMPSGGLVIDVRDNPGGYISTGERLLQTLTPNTITPEPMQFINTQTSLQFCTMFLEFEGWIESIRRGLETKATFSSDIPYSSSKLCNNVGQHYYGPVVLVTNALCYSTTDIFAAGFQDHGIGKVLGTDGSTGAGGANVMTLSALRKKFERVRAAAKRVGNPVPNWPLGEQPLPLNADLRVAIRRTLRVGKRSGMELEDLGVQPDVHHRMTRADVLAGNVDLLTKAAELLRGMPHYVLKELTVQGGQHGDDDPVVAEVQTSGIEWLDVAVDGWASGSQVTQDGNNRITARRAPGRPPQTLELCGYRMKEGEPTLVARRKIEMAKPARG